MFEHKSEPLATRRVFARRMGRHALFALAFVVGSLAIGVIGYHGLERMSYIDALLNASMLLGGMGPVGDLHTVAGKLFASAYALYSGMGFLVAAAVLFAPAIHRFLHEFHLAPTEGSGGDALRKSMPGHGRPRGEGRPRRAGRGKS
jgi:hypothetical protein